MVHKASPGMNHPIIKKILIILSEYGKLPEKHSGEINIKINMNEGGISQATLSVTEKLK